MLLQYFITELSPWRQNLRQFDFCDKDRHFGTTVVQLSSTCEPLLNAILAVSAKHLSLTSEYCPLASDKYQRKCLQILIPALNDQDSLLDPTLFAATAILRLFDEMTDPVGDRRSRGHILGTHILLRAQETPSPTSSLRAASLLVALRQEIFISFFTRTAVQPLADYLPISRSSSSSASPDDSDYAWAVRAIALAADALTFCHGQAGKSVEGWQALRARLDAWQRGKPPSFAPVRHEPRRPFPRICFANDCHSESPPCLARRGAVFG
ncbi:arca-like protein [Neofusicoccum parvum]|uniref:Arca-like protein n=1 Tax=Neofusicoccum parvum TaxID=310453 RepID=A0ACB5S1L6_9PEZI|nr:arca-like protein [Neofusicoccum parvum]